MASTNCDVISLHLLTSLVITYLASLANAAPTSLSSIDNGDGESSPESLAIIIVSKAEELFDKFCTIPGLCDSMERSLKKELKLPENTISDGCLRQGFNEEKCLHKIHGDLLKFQPYLEFLKESNEINRQTVESMQHKTNTLAETMEKNPCEEPGDSKPDISVEGLKSNVPWNEKVTTYTILQSFKDYMEKTTRAIRRIQKSRT
ncbi:interleukin-6 [Gastrophryne carolinensis]